ncbi:MAG: hypothetical protein DWH81_01300 [Planctomycetota bacterium]|nr:MAG: hypothetical protein DWH81_01300 [Planctomycetota bacterium]
MHHNTFRFSQWIMSLAAIVLLAMLWNQKMAHHHRKSFTVVYNNTVPLFLKIDTKTDTLEGVFFVGSFDPSHVAKSVKSEIKDGQQKSLAILDWNVSKPSNPSTFPSFSLSIPNEIHSQTLNISIMAE